MYKLCPQQFRIRAQKENLDGGFHLHLSSCLQSDLTGQGGGFRHRVYTENLNTDSKSHVRLTYQDMCICSINSLHYGKQCQSWNVLNFNDVYYPVFSGCFVALTPIQAISFYMYGFEALMTNQWQRIYDTSELKLRICNSHFGANWPIPPTFW